MEHQDREQRLLARAIDGVVSKDPQIACKSRFTRDVYVPILNWVEGERQRALSVADNQERAMAMSLALTVMAEGLGMAMGNCMAEHARHKDETRNEAIAEVMGALFAKMFVERFLGKKLQ